MSKVIETYTFIGFGFEVLLKNVVIKEANGEEYPDLNMNELKLATAKALLTRQVRLTGLELKFLRTFLKVSYDILGDKIRIPASTIRSWENKGKDVTGLTTEQEKALRFFVINSLLDRERNKFDQELSLAKTFAEPKKGSSVLDIAANSDYSFVANG